MISLSIIGSSSPLRFVRFHVTFGFGIPDAEQSRVTFCPVSSLYSVVGSWEINLGATKIER